MLVAGFALTSIRFAAAILLDTAALVVWDIGTRSPRRVIADMFAGLWDRRAVLRGCSRFALGAAALVAAVAVCTPLVSRAIDRTIIECWALVAALLVEGLIGPDLRTRLR